MDITNSPKTLEPQDRFTIEDAPLDFTALEFWQWAYSDIQLNNIRGVFAEFIIAKALNLSLGLRQTWDDWDLETDGGIKIEVKSGAYLQAWEQNKLSSIVFQGLKGQEWNEETNRREGEKKYRADIYIFAVQTTKSNKEFDPLNLAQWVFYILTKKDLEKRNTQSISLSVIQKLTNAVRYADLDKEFGKVAIV